MQALGELCERNAWRMHATALAADPPLCYLKPETLALMSALREQRKKGMPVWFTLDAGPNPVLLTDAAHELAAEARRGLRRGGRGALRAGRGRAADGGAPLLMERALSAPGKLFLSGEYAVLWGGVRAVAAVGPRTAALVRRRADREVHVCWRRAR